jgi:hypothetical protein
VTFTVTNVAQYYTVPTGVDAVAITATGVVGAGETQMINSTTFGTLGGPGGPGAVVKGLVPVAAGDVLEVLVGGQGVAGGLDPLTADGGGAGGLSSDAVLDGGAGGGGSANIGGGGGGGATEIIDTTTQMVLLAAGAGGGGGGYGAGLFSYVGGNGGSAGSANAGGANGQGTNDIAGTEHHDAEVPPQPGDRRPRLHRHRDRHRAGTARPERNGHLLQRREPDIDRETERREPRSRDDHRGGAHCARPGDLASGLQRRQRQHQPERGRQPNSRRRTLILTHGGRSRFGAETASP